jgi:septal ring-binding cell division protein DamX
MTAPVGTPLDAAPATGCPRCGAPLRPGQDWCLACGAAVTTHVAGSPGWRTPLAIVGVVLTLAAAALVVAFLQMSDDAQQVAQAPPAQAPPAAAPAPAATAAPTASAIPTPAATPATGATPGATPGATASPTGEGGSPAGTPTPATAAGTVAPWPSGRTAWTVILVSTTTRADADRKAKSFADQGKPVGVLHSDDFRSLRPGFWVVFSGQYDDQKAAQDATTGLKSTAPDAYARKIEPK